MAKYRKKPVVIEAIQYNREENIHQVLDFAGESMEYDVDSNEYYIETLEGKLFITKGDYIIKGVQGEFYPCKPDIFKQTYEPVQSPSKATINVNFEGIASDVDKVARKIGSSISKFIH